MHDLSQFMERAQKTQGLIDEMGFGDPVEKENADLRRQLEEAHRENERLTNENKRLRKRMIGMVPLGKP